MATTRKACFEGTPEYDKCLEDAVAYAKHKNMAVDVQSVYKLIHGVILMGDQGWLAVLGMVGKGRWLSSG